MKQLYKDNAIEVREDGSCVCIRADITSVTIPDSVTTIGEHAFYGCTGLTSVTIPNSVTAIGDEAFAWCKNLTSISIPDSVTTIGECAFFGCKNLTPIIIPDSVTAIGDNTFSWCENLTSIAIPNTIRTIGNCAFSWCKNLTSITIPDSVTAIGDSAFWGCENLTVHVQSKRVEALVKGSGYPFEVMPDVFSNGAVSADPTSILKDAQGEDLPVYDREVIVLIQDHPEHPGSLRVAYGHRPKPDGYVTSKGEKIYPMTYGKGGWNGDNVKYWLDLVLPIN